MKNVRVGQSCRSAAGDIAEWSDLERLVVILAPLEIVDRRGRARVVAVRIWRARQFGTRICRMWIVPVHIPVQAAAREIEDPIEGLAGSRICGELQIAQQAWLDPSR